MRVKFVLGLSTVTWASRIAEPEESVTVPRSEVVACPQAAVAHTLIQTRR